MRGLFVVDLGRRSYGDALDLQRQVARARIVGDVDQDVLLFVEHPPVITLGRSSKAAHMLATPEHLRRQGVELFEVERGGDVTFHGPGQLVGYPIVRVNDVVAYVRLLEQALVQALSDEGIRGRARPEEGPDFTGVWVEDRKIASIGVHVARGVTTHGFAVNVENDLQPFGWVVPCGLEGVQMTSLIKETGRLAGQLKCFRRRAAFCVSEALGRRQRLVSLSRLEAAVSPPAATPV